MRSLRAASPSASASATPNWTLLFDGKSLDGWKITRFGGEGEVVVEDGRLILDQGNTLSGVTYRGQLPTTDYELSLEAMRVEGIDFFCGLTFPVADSHCSLIVGGWAGAVVGLSSIDGKDASENETTRYMNFKEDRWYKIRVRVARQNIVVWIDERKVIDQKIAGRRITTRNEVNLSKPLGISAWQTRAAIRDVKIRQIKQE